eukprot:gnl/MRDRNA2_/MRDRNA2_101269_c0_seq1.p1 gnl/MRDRNA2_/MRDRNA2_101269_c0~~gnl/MRDRNA2_/MRDRNA2_101269_c0_seq1.p1  ORF type:complete len:576 (-),score=70.27 gnl/MRDRNA2_/MRDRNA2_101269_c0_seq1:244-1971(-)
MFNDRMNKVKTAFAERAIYKDMMNDQGVVIAEDQSFARGAEPVQEKRNRSSIKEGEMLVQRKAIPNEYFVGSVTRNPFTGLVFLEKIERTFDFTIVDLFDRDYVMGSPEDLSCDMYLFRPQPLGYRSWVYHQIIMLQELALRGMKNLGGMEYVEMLRFDLLKVAFAYDLIDENTGAFGRYSPFQPASVAMLLMSLTVDIPLMFLAFYLFLINFAVTKYTNHPKLFRWHRFLSFPLRAPVTIAVTAHLGQIGTYAELGKWIPLMSILLAWLILVGDHTMGDASNITAFSLEKRFEIQRVLPGGVYLCEVLGGEENVPRSAQDEVSPELVGAKYLGISQTKMRNCVLLVDVQGLICELKAITLDQWRMHRSHGTDLMSAFSTRTFSNLRPDGEFFQKDGSFRNLYEIMGLRDDGSYLDDTMNQQRRSFLGRRGTYQLPAPPVGAPGGPENDVPAPPTDAPPVLGPSLSYVVDRQNTKVVERDRKSVETDGSDVKWGPIDSMMTGARASTVSKMHKYDSVKSGASRSSVKKQASRPQSAPAGPSSERSKPSHLLMGSGDSKRPQSAATSRKRGSTINE